MNKRWLALVLTGAVSLSVLGGTVLAAAEGENPSDSVVVETDKSQEGQVEGQTGDNQGEETQEETSPQDQKVEPDSQTQQSQESAEEPEAYIPDEVGEITFDNLERRLREHNLSILALEENIQSIEVIDYEDMTNNIRWNINNIAETQWFMNLAGMGNSPEAQALDQAYSSLRKTFESLQEGELQQDNADVVRQLKNAQNQMVMAGESLYIAIMEMEQNDQTIDRNLAALDRSLQELELRYKLGQIPSQTLKQTQASRVALISSQQTLTSNIHNYKMQLELMSGGELNGAVRLGGLPQVSTAQLEEMDLEGDLAQAKAVSYNLYAAQKALEDAKEEYRNQISHANYQQDRYEYQMAKHQWQGAQYNYNATVQNFEIAFRTLYAQVKDFKQVLDASKTALAVEQENYAVAQLKHTQGSLSDNKLLEAEDKVKEAQEKVDGAANDLFSAYNNYRWAVDYGILN